VVPLHAPQTTHVGIATSRDASDLKQLEGAALRRHESVTACGGMAARGQQRVSCTMCQARKIACDRDSLTAQAGGTRPPCSRCVANGVAHLCVDRPPRRPVAVACEACFQDKRKCSGSFPCSRCAERGVACVPRSSRVRASPQPVDDPSAKRARLLKPPAVAAEDSEGSPLLSLASLCLELSVSGQGPRPWSHAAPPDGAEAGPDAKLESGASPPSSQATPKDERASGDTDPSSSDTSPNMPDAPEFMRASSVPVFRRDVLGASPFEDKRAATSVR
jgi:hypothetical protein